MPRAIVIVLAIVLISGIAVTIASVSQAGRSPLPAPAASAAMPVRAASPVVPPPAAGEDAPRPLLALIADPALPESTRLAAIERTAARGDDAAERELVGAVESGAHLAPEAVRALEGMGRPSARQYVERSTAHGHPMVAAAAIHALGRRGAAAVPLIERAMDANRERPDGFEEPVRAAAIEALADTGAAAAVAPMARALAAIDPSTSLGYAHADTIVAALVRLGRPEGVPALQAHLARLQRDRDAIADNPLGRTYLDGLAAATSAAIAALGGSPRNHP